MWFLLGSVVSKFETMLLLFTSTQENLEDNFASKKTRSWYFLVLDKDKDKDKDNNKDKDKPDGEVLSWP